MCEELKKAYQEYNDGQRMFNYAANGSVEIDVAISLMNSANMKIQALKLLPQDVYIPEPDVPKSKLSTFFTSIRTKEVL